MTSLQVAWVIYVVGGLGCCLAAGWIFKKTPVFLRSSAVLTVMVLLFTPYAIDPQTMLMAPAIFTLVFDGFQLGLESIKPLLKLMAGIWSIGMVLILVYVFFTRHSESPQTREVQNLNDNFSAEGTQASFAPTPTSVKKIGRTSSANPIDNPIENPIVPITTGDLHNGDLHQQQEQARPRKLLTEEIPIRAIRD